MKRISKLILLALGLFSAACSSYLDINTNPNTPTAVTPNLVLPQALAATAASLNGYNTYGSQIGGYAANAGGYGGFNELVSYAYTTNNYATGLWSNAYDNLEDYQYIINSTQGDDANIYFSAVATIMRVYNFQLLVDTFNDVPYTDALKGSTSLTPKYDSPTDIYAGLASELDAAIAQINTGNGFAAKPNPITNYDIVFKGDMTKWIQLANTIKLKLIVHGTGKVTFGSTSFDPAGYLTTDALINPGYTRDINRQNPAWNTWAFGYTGTAGNKAWVPTTWMVSWYDGTNLKDPGRGNAMYYQFGTAISNQLGVETVAAPKCPTGSRWYPGSDRGGTSAGNSTGTLKGPNAGYPMFSAAESYFLQAEAAVRGISLVGSPTAQSSYNSGIAASFNYTYMLADGSISGTPAADAVAYQAANASYLANFPTAGSVDNQIESIITQKYIALNFVSSHEGWNDYRRTGYPTVSGTGATTTFASTASISPRPDRLPTRILYPASEAQYNPANAISGISPFTSLIFYAK